MKPDGLTHHDHPCERWYLMNQFISRIENNNKILQNLIKPDSLTAVFHWHGQSESVNQPTGG